MAVTSVKARQRRIDSHRLSQGAREHAALDGSLEAGEAAARVGAASGLVAAGDEDALAGREADQLALRRPPAAAGAAPQRGCGYEDSSSPDGSVTSTGIPAGTSSGGATSASGEISGCPSSVTASATSATSAVSSASSASGGGPAT
jgi:hypothetical protein